MRDWAKKTAPGAMLLSCDGKALVLVLGLASRFGEASFFWIVYRSEMVLAGDVWLSECSLVCRL